MALYNYMKLESKAGRFICSTYTDGYPYRISLQYEAIAGEPFEIVSFPYDQLDDLEYTVQKIQRLLTEKTKK